RQGVRTNTYYCKPLTTDHSLLATRYSSWVKLLRKLLQLGALGRIEDALASFLHVEQGLPRLLAIRFQLRPHQLAQPVAVFRAQAGGFGGAPPRGSSLRAGAAPPAPARPPDHRARSPV